MRVIGIKILHDFCKKHSDVKSQIGSWLAEVKDANWQNPNELRARHPSASLVNDRMVFNIKGGKYRLLARVNYKSQVVRIEDIGTHEKYDRWNL